MRERSLPTIKNCALELPTFGVIVGVSPTEVQWKGLTLEEPPSWSWLTSAPGKYASSTVYIQPCRAQFRDGIAHFHELLIPDSVPSPHFIRDKPLRIMLLAQEAVDSRLSKSHSFSRLWDICWLISTLHGNMTHTASGRPVFKAPTTRNDWYASKNKQKTQNKTLSIWKLCTTPQLWSNPTPLSFSYIVSFRLNVCIYVKSGNRTKRCAEIGLPNIGKDGNRTLKRRVESRWTLVEDSLGLFLSVVSIAILQET